MYSDEYLPFTHTDEANNQEQSGLIVVDINQHFILMLYNIAGIIVMIIILSDVITTTLSLQGGGWLTRWLMRGGWLSALYISRNNGRARYLSHVGYILLLSMLLFWVLGLWGSFILILLADEGNIVNSSTQQPAPFWDKVYYAGYTISSLGNGEFQPNTIMWRMVASFYTFTGIIMITLSITYLVPALSAVLNKNKLSIYIGSMGYTPSQIIMNGWNGQNFNRLINHCATVAPLLIVHSQNHRAYPVIHYFHLSSPQNSVTLRLAALFEALIILKYYVKDTAKPDLIDLAPVFTAFENYLELSLNGSKDTFDRAIMHRLIDKELLNSGLLNSREITATIISEKDTNQREALKRLVEEDGWSWSELGKQTDK